MAVYGADTRNDREKARRQLDRLASEGLVHREPGALGGDSGREPAKYFPVSLLTPGGADGAF
jgi:hypothetical protein